jgi:hypothetical protein
MIGRPKVIADFTIHAHRIFVFEHFVARVTYWFSTLGAEHDRCDAFVPLSATITLKFTHFSAEIGGT